jgi:hypothetical protein
MMVEPNFEAGLRIGEAGDVGHAATDQGLAGHGAQFLLPGGGGKIIAHAAAGAAGCVVPNGFALDAST